MAISSQHQHIFAIIIYVFSYVIFRSIYIYIWELLSGYSELGLPYRVSYVIVC
jgi:hypothetical protein